MIQKFQIRFYTIVQKALQCQALVPGLVILRKNFTP